MVATMKPIEARQSEARARSRANGVRLEVLESGKLYQSRSVSRPGLVHTIKRLPTGWACSCEGHHFSGICMHIAGLERRLIREGACRGFKIAPRGYQA